MTKIITVEEASFLVEQLISYSLDKLSLNEDDVYFVRNQLLDLLQIPEPAAKAENYGNLQDILDSLVSYAISKNIIKKIDSYLFETKMMGIVTPLPSQIISEFDMIASEKGIQQATDNFYNQSIASNYIRMVDIKKNIGWDYKGSKGPIKVTINLSKPEKDPKEVLAAAKTINVNYPKCKLCPSNVGFAGNYDYPPRQTLRTIPIFLNEENWHLQYSPYSYFQEHLIALSEEHRPMSVDNLAIKRMLDFVEIFPHYFIGSNAALPIVGGSILSHDHYQGGAKVMPMMKAETKKDYYNPMFPSVTLQILNWYNSVIRLSGTNREELEKTAAYIMDYWSTYSDEKIGIIAKTAQQHNAITPIVRLENNRYIIDYILRNNRIDDAHPYGIYHPTEDLHNIKKESIGIIEVMGLFILPGRLYKECILIKNYLTGKKKLDFKEIADENNILYKHLAMIAQLTNDNGTQMSSVAASEVIMNYINNACEKILNCTALFKDTEEGNKAFIDLILSMGFDE